MSFIRPVCSHAPRWILPTIPNEASVSIEKYRGNFPFPPFEHFPYVLERENQLYLRVD